MSAETFNVSELRSALKKIGYRLKTTRTSEFIAGKILAPDGAAINAGNIFTPQFLETHQRAFDIRAEFKGKIFSGAWRVVI